MYNVEDLFDKRSVVGAKLEQIMAESNYKKAKLCKDAGVSRPTLDKVLAGTLTSKTNYEKHITKILHCLSLVPDNLLSNVQNPYNRAGVLRETIRMSSDAISCSTKISVKRLKEIEAGDAATTAELRDIAFHLYTSVRSVLGTNFFETPIALLHDIVNVYNDENSNDLSGFWGHIGVLPVNSEECLWFPITGNARRQIHHSIDSEHMVIPCMNNKLLYINMKNIKDIILLDDACDPPSNVNWDYDVECGDVPLVVYEALEDYFYSDKDSIDTDKLSVELYNIIDNIVSSKGWSEDEVYELLNKTTIHYTDGTESATDIYYDGEESISSEVSSIYAFGDDSLTENILYYSDFNGAENFINMNNVSFMEMPLLKTEQAICESFKKL